MTVRFLVLLLLVVAISSGSIPFADYLSQYVYSDSFQIISTPSASLNTISGTNTLRNYKLTYLTAQTNQNYSLFISIESVSQQLNVAQMSIILDTESQTLTNVGIKIMSNDFTKVYLLSYRYMVISSTFPLFYINKEMEFTNLTITSPGTRAFNFSYTLNTSYSDLKFQGFITSYNYSSFLPIPYHSIRSGQLKLNTQPNNNLIKVSLQFNQKGTIINYQKIHIFGYYVDQLADYNDGRTVLLEIYMDSKDVRHDETLDFDFDVNFGNLFYGVSEIKHRYRFIHLDYCPPSNIIKSQIRGNNSVDLTHSKLYCYRYQFNYLAIYNKTCPSDYPIVDVLNSRCSQNCSFGFYFNYSSGTCQICHKSCRNCSGGSEVECESCYGSRNRRLSNGSCLPKVGFFESSAGLVFECIQPCYECVNSSTTCTSCFANSNYFLNTSTSSCQLSSSSSSFETSNIGSPCNSQLCKECLYFPMHCTSCLNDNQTYLLNNNCQKCSRIDQHCNSCNSTGSCLGCDVGYRLVNGSCDQIMCGDGQVQDGEECDDGGNVGGDGCSQQCQVEDQFYCRNVSVNGYGSISHCFVSFLEVQFVYLEKTHNQNQIYVELSVRSPAKIWKSINFLNSLKHINPQLEEVSSCSLTGYSYIVGCFFGYSKDIQYDNITLFLNLSLSEVPQLAEIPIKNVSFVCEPSNNEPAVVQDASTTTATELVEFGCMALQVMLVLLFVMSLFKQVVLFAELLTVFQLTFFSLLSLEWPTPVFRGLMVLSYSAGITQISAEEAYRNNDLSLEVRGAGINPNKLVNGSFLLVIYLLVIVAAIISKIMIVRSRQQQQKLQNELYLQSVVYQKGFFASYIYIYPNIIVAYVIVSTGLSNYFSSIQNIVSFAICVVSLVVGIAYLLLLLKNNIKMGQFERIFKSFTMFSYSYILLSIFKVIQATILAAVSSPLAQNGTVVFLIIIPLLVIIFCQPYKLNVSRQQYFVIFMSNLLIQAIFLMRNCQDWRQSYNMETYLYLPTIIVFILFIVTVYVGFFIVKSFVEKVQQIRKPSQKKSKDVKLFPSIEEQINFEIVDQVAIQRLKNNYTPLKDQQYLQQSWDYYDKRPIKTNKKIQLDDINSEVQQQQDDGLKGNQGQRNRKKLKQIIDKQYQQEASQSRRLSNNLPINNSSLGVKELDEKIRSRIVNMPTHRLWQEIEDELEQVGGQKKVAKDYQQDLVDKEEKDKVWLEL